MGRYRETFFFGLRYFKKHILVFMLALFMGTFVVLVSAYLPRLVKMLTDYCLVVTKSSGEAGVLSFLVDGRFGEAGSLQLLIALVLAYICMLFVRHIFIYLKYYIAKSQSTKLDGKFRQITFEKMLKDNKSVSAHYNNGELMQILDKNVITFKDLYFFQLPLIYDYMLSIIMSAVMLAGVNVYLMLISLSLLPFMIIVLIKLFKAYGHSGEILWKKSSQLNKLVQERIYGMRLVKSLVREGYEQERMDRINDEYKSINISRVDIISKYRLLLNILYNLPYAVAVGAGAIMVIQGVISAGEYISFTLYMVMVMGGVLGLVDVLANAQHALIDGSKFYNLVNLPADADASATMTVSDRPVIEIKNAGFTIGEQTILSGIDLRVEFGMRVGIIGAAGSGKTALMNLLSGYIDCTEGAVLIDTVPIGSIARDELYRIFSYNFQDNFLFSDTVSNNVLMQMQDDGGRLEDALKTADIWAFVSEAADGADLVVGERGVGLSGGQRQRITIARAVAKKSPILILDDSLSAVDRRTEANILNNLQSGLHACTLFLITNRVASLQAFDIVLYMEKGRIVERGTLKQLLDANGKTADLFKMQLLQQGADDED